MQLKWDSTTKYQNIVREKKLVLQRKYHKLCIISLYIMYVTTFYIKFIFHFPKNNTFMLTTPRTERYEGVLYLFYHACEFPDCILCEYVIVM